ncbi:MAG TPA: transketolase C-terminal domain-containing protein [bacterium]|nr:transketolase C-terminal domain-containing protein [bacterium]HPQ66581.1 transketolase C-terminal domain-containing protein [bacterium]
MRQGFIRTVMDLAAEREDVYLVTADTGFTILERFRERYPDRYLNVGIAEAAMVGVAAGLALSGKRVFCYTIVPFATMRCFEQIRVDLCYQKLPVALVGVGQGLTYGTAGATHHAIEDIAVMRALPGMTVICPGDALETARAVRASLELDGPCYIRIGKSGEPPVHESEDFEFEIGKGCLLRPGRGLALIATSNMVEPALRVAEALAAAGEDPAVVSMHTVKPLDRGLLEELSRTCPLLATMEEHSLIGGLGSAVAEAVVDGNLPVKVVRFGIPDTYAPVAGSQDYLRELLGFSPAHVAARLKEELVEQ